MNALIVYDSTFGNTERIARAIAGRLESALLIRAEEAGTLERPECDLLIVAGPTQRHGVSPALREWLERLPRGALKDVPAAAFDTRYRMSWLLSGSAAARIASHGPTQEGRGAARGPAGELLHGARCAAARREAPPRDGAAGAGRGGTRDRVGCKHPRAGGGGTPTGCSAVIASQTYLPQVLIKFAAHYPQAQNVIIL
jgi:hypothetical protein